MTTISRPPAVRVTPQAEEQGTDREYAHPFNLPVLGMALALWAIIALVVLGVIALF